MKKSTVLENWKRLEADQPILPVMLPIAYRATGSKYGACGIRIDGTPEFIDAILSHLKELIDGENDDTRLQLSRSKVENNGNHNFANRELDAECCYIRLHERGVESKMLNRMVRAAKERAKMRRAAEEDSLD